jgi:hypothetical protein
MVSNIITILAFASAAVAHPQRHRPWQHWGTDRLSAAAAGPTGAALPINGTNSGGAPVEPPVAVVSEGDSTALITSTITSTTVELVTFTAGLAPQQTAQGNALEQLAPGTSVSLEASSVAAGAFYNKPTWGGDNTYSYGGVPSSAPAAVPTTFATALSPAPAGASSAAPVSSSVPSTGGGGGGGSSSGGKKGLSYNAASLTNAFAGTGISWAYNWAAGPGGTILSGAEFVPMLWGLDGVSAWAGAAQSAIASGSKHVLSFNEPDHSEQAQIDPQTAAKSHIANVAPLSGQVSIGSPGVTNGPAPMGISWLQSFFDACGGQCNIDFVAFHWYDSATNVAYFKQHVQDVIDTAAKNGVSKVWLTEFGASGSDSEVAGFIQEVIPWLDSQPAVERYAYFMCSDGILVKGNSISSPIGSAYAS